MYNDSSELNFDYSMNASIYCSFIGNNYLTDIDSIKQDWKIYGHLTTVELIELKLPAGPISKINVKIILEVVVLYYLTDHDSPLQPLTSSTLYTI